MNPITMQLAVNKYIRLALEEDINGEGVTTCFVMPDYKEGEVQLICKEDGAIAGLQIFERVFTLLDSQTQADFLAKDGGKVTNGQLMRKVHGDIRVLLSGERTVLNYLQRTSGIATHARNVADMLEDSKTCLADTRKTTPCIRAFEKYAVLAGGGKNHRYNLSDGVLLKDNHIDMVGDVKQAIEAVRRHAPFVRKIEVETGNLDMVKEVVETGVDIIMLDNMTPAQMKEAVQLIDGRAETGCSGNITKENTELMKDLGVNYVSNGALTHSAPALDINLRHLSVPGEQRKNHMDKKVADSPMATALIGSQRRKRILTMMSQSSHSLSGGVLGRDTGVSRQVVVQDITLLRAEGYPVIATARGYTLDETKKAVRLFKACHATEQISEELETIADLGGSVEDMMTNHGAYGKMSAPLRVQNCRDVTVLLENLKIGKSTPLMNVTAGYHFRYVAADSQGMLDETEEHLCQKHLLVEFLPYELEEESIPDMK